MGAGADVAGAAAGRLAAGAPKALELDKPLQHLEASGGQVGVLGGPKLSPRAQAWANKAGKARTTAQDMIAEGSVQPMARQVMYEQEAAKRGAELQTNIAQAGLEGKTVPGSLAAEAIRADAMAIRPITSAAKAQRRELLSMASRLRSAGDLTAEQLDDFLRQVDDAAGQGKATKAPVEHLNNASKHLRNLRDRFANPDEEFTIVEGAPDTVVTPKKVAGIRDSDGNVKVVEGYSELKARQHKDRVIQEFKNARALGGGNVTPQAMSAEPVLAEVGPGQNVDDVLSGITPKVKLNLPQHNAIKANIRKIAKPDDLADTEEMLALAKRVGPGMERKLRIIQQLDDADALASALGRTINGVSARGGNLGAFFDRKQLFRAVPTLKGLSGGLPPRSSGAASESAVARFKEFIKRRLDKGAPSLAQEAGQVASRVPGAAGKAVAGFKSGLRSPDKQTTFMPSLPSLGLRAGLPTRVVGAALDKPDKSTAEFSPEEEDFWMQVMDNLAKDAAK
jgi:hypothetical protein